MIGQAIPGHFVADNRLMCNCSQGRDWTRLAQRDISDGRVCGRPGLEQVDRGLQGARGQVQVAVGGGGVAVTGELLDGPGGGSGGGEAGAEGVSQDVGALEGEAGGALGPV